MLTPRADLEPRAERPSWDVPWWMHLLSPFARLSKRRIHRRYLGRGKDWATRLPDISTENREELESELGPPRYVMAGTHYSTSVVPDQAVRPDLVEVYQRNGCVLEVWFKDDRVMFSHGYAMPTNWEFIAGVLDPA